MDYELFHDESIVEGFWHGMLLVPALAKARLAAALDEARSSTGYGEPISLKSLRGPGPKLDTADAWVQIGVAALMSRARNIPYPAFLGAREGRQKRYSFITDHFGCKFILLRERDALAQMGPHRDRASKVETTFRMGLKGGLHFLGLQDEYIHIAWIHFDGHLHLKRHVNKQRAIDRIVGLRDYCSLSRAAEIIDDRTSDHREPEAQAYEDCSILQMTDLLVGLFRALLTSTGTATQLRIAHPVRELLRRYHQGPARMRNSRWYNSLCMSQCYIDGSAWKFDTLEYEPIREDLQMPLQLEIEPALTR